jgi:hypothetical protein
MNKKSNSGIDRVSKEKSVIHEECHSKLIGHKQNNKNLHRHVIAVPQSVVCAYIKRAAVALLSFLFYKKQQLKSTVLLL